MTAAIKSQCEGLIRALALVGARPTDMITEGDDAGETPVHIAVKQWQDVNDVHAEGAALATIDVGGLITTTNKEGKSVLDVCVNDNIKNKIIEFKASKVGSYHKGFKLKMIPKLRETEIAAYEARKQEEERVKEEERKIREHEAQMLAQRKGDMTSKLLDAALDLSDIEVKREKRERKGTKTEAEDGGDGDDDSGAVDDAIKAARLLEEQKRKEQEAASAALAAAMARGKKDRDGDDATKAAEAAEAAKQRDAEAAQAALLEKLKGGKDKESASERKRRLAIEALEAELDKEVTSMGDASALNSEMMTNMFYKEKHIGYPDALAKIIPFLSQMTKKRLEEAKWEYKYWRRNIQGIHETLIEDLEEDGGPEYMTSNIGMTVDALVKRIDADFGHLSNRSKHLSEVNMKKAPLSKRVKRELERRQVMTKINIMICDDILRKLIKDDEEREKAFGALPSRNELKVFREEEEEAFHGPIVNPIINQSILDELKEINNKYSNEIEKQLSTLDEDERSGLVIGSLDKVINDIINQPEFTAKGELEMQEYYVSRQVRALRDEVISIEDAMNEVTLESEGGEGGEGGEGKGITTAAIEDGKREKERIEKQMAPLDTFNAALKEMINKVEDAMKKRYEALTPEERLWEAKKRAQMVAELNARKNKLSIDDKNVMKARENQAQRLQALRQRIFDEFKSYTKPSATPAINVKRRGEGEDIDDKVDIDWLNNQIDLTGVDKDLVEYIKRNPPNLIRRYLAIKAAENEADAAFIRRLLQKQAKPTTTSPTPTAPTTATVTTTLPGPPSNVLTPSQKEDLAMHQRFLNRRLPMIKRLFDLFSAKAPQLEVNDILAEKENVVELHFAKLVHDATVEARDWNDFREQRAADTFFDALVAAFDDMPEISSRFDLPRQALMSIHRSLHCMCDVKEDVVMMIVDEIGGGKVDRRNFVKCLHALQVACRRDQQVYWDSKVIQPDYPHPYGTMSRYDAELTFAFNDHDVRGRYFDLFEDDVERASTKITSDHLRHFSPDIFSREALGLSSPDPYLSRLPALTSSTYLLSSSLSTPAARMDADISNDIVSSLSQLGDGGDDVQKHAKRFAKTNSGFISPLLRETFYRRDRFISPEDLDPVLHLTPYTAEDIRGFSKEPESTRPHMAYRPVPGRGRMEYGYGDLHAALVVPPKMDLSNPRGWTYD